jgi:polyphosphate kinase
VPDPAAATVAVATTDGQLQTAPAPAPPSLPAAGAGPDLGLDNPELYLNRELTWLAFNERVLDEATRDRNPLLEQVKFLGITASNLDEFFMKRIGGLKQQVVAGLHELTVDGRTPRQQIAECYAVIRPQEARQRAIFAVLRDRLASRGIHLVAYQGLPDPDRQKLRAYYLKNVHPLVTPQAIDPAHPFPVISNLSLNLLVTGRAADTNEPFTARVKVPLGYGIPRLVRVDGTDRLVPLEDIMAHCLDLLFPDATIDACELFRVTRNANTERDEDEADDLLALIESELRDRRFAPIVRLEVGRDMGPVHRGMLASELGLDQHDDVFEVDGLLALRDLGEVAAIDRPDLHDPPYHPVDHPLMEGPRNIFHTIRDAGSILFAHPYESFATSVERFLKEASQDPKVRAVKMTLYRTSPDAEVLDYLCDAARNGKAVAVVVELKARFDEAANIGFASRLEDFGIHVTYGVVGYKTHCKCILVVRQDHDGLRRYAHIGTGNYHPGTARLYSDFGLLTTDEAITQDLTELFNFLTTGYRGKRVYRKILPAPMILKEALLDKIEREAALGPLGKIQFKMNALEDEDITRALYRAARAGVSIDLLVRDTCRLRPGLAGLSASVHVTSIVGRFLEHGRIYYFRNDGAEEYFIGSADCMKRNLESRVEVVTPVDDPLARKKLRAVLDLQLVPNRDAWHMRPDGSYEKTPEDEAHVGCQQALIDLVETRRQEFSKVGKKRRKGYARRHVALTLP